MGYTGFSWRQLLLLGSTGASALGPQQLWCVGSVLGAPGSGAWTSVAVVCGLSTWGFQAWTSVAVVPRLSCSLVCGIFLDQGSNPCSLHWQADSYLLRCWESPTKTSSNDSGMHSG